MHDMFGQDAGNISEGAPAVAPPASPAAVAAATPVPVGGPPAGAAPTLAQAVDKAVAKQAADATVAADPHAVHHVKLAPLAPNALGATAAGALIGSAILPGPGTLIGAGVGYVSERWQIGGGLFGKSVNKVKTVFKKIPGTSTPAAK